MEDKRDSFLNQIKIEKINNIEKTVNNLKSGKITIDDLTEIQKIEVFKFLKKEVAGKSIKLHKLENLIFKDKIEELQDIDISDVLNELSEEDRNAFIDFLNNKI